MEKITSFIKVNDAFINLKSVSNINPLPHRNRVVYNFSYPIVLTTRGESKIISDYQYNDFHAEVEFDEALVELSKNTFIQKNFIQQDRGYINKEKISSFKVQEDRLRVIFNMSHSIEIESRRGSTIAPEFVYVNLQDKKEFNEYISYLNKYLV